MSETANKRITILLIIVFVVSTVFLAVPTINITAVAETQTYDTTSVIDDLKNSYVNGKNFNFSLYPEYSGGSVQVINVVEYCYSANPEKRENYGIYIYIYNPANVDIVATSGHNKIQMALTYTKEGEPVNYYKFKLKCISQVESGAYKNRFFKYKVMDNDENGISLFDRVKPEMRRYDISGVELMIRGNRTATEYGVGGTYNFTGYAKGCGADKEAESTLNCVVKRLETIDLEVHHTNFRTNVSSAGADHYNEVNTVYFSVPERVYKTYGALQKIRAEWWEYKTKLGLVTSDQNFYSVFKDCTDDYVGDANESITPYLYKGAFSFTNSSGGLFPYTTIASSYDWAFNISEKHDSGLFWSDTTTVQSSTPMIPYAFYSPAANDIDGVFDCLYAKQNVGSVENSAVADWIYNYKNGLGNGYVDCNGRQISVDLFEDGVDDGRTRGYNDVTIDLSDTFNLDSYDSNHSWWDKLWTYGFSWPQTDGDYKDIVPIYELQASDLIGTNEYIAENLLVNENDVNALQAFYAKEAAKGNRVILFRFAKTDYYCTNVGGGNRDGSGYHFSEDDKIAYLAQETVFLDFDIIELTFNNDGVYMVIPVVASPIDIINGLDPPAEEFQWWKILIAVLMLVLLIVLLIPILPYVFQGLVWIVMLPVKGIKALVYAIRKKNKGG